jgi:hypothetical protein
MDQGQRNTFRHMPFEEEHVICNTFLLFMTNSYYEYFENSNTEA